MVEALNAEELTSRGLIIGILVVGFSIATILAYVQWDYLYVDTRRSVFLTIFSPFLHVFVFIGSFFFWAFIWTLIL